MPFIQFTIQEGRSLEQKERLIHEVSDLTAEI
jgi:4-oxalocrotonate tautomerase family enzyme